MFVMQYKESRLPYFYLGEMLMMLINVVSLPLYLENFLLSRLDCDVILIQISNKKKRNERYVPIFMG